MYLIHFCAETRKIIIMKTYLYNFDSLKSHFYTVTLVFTGVYIIFLISAKKTNKKKNKQKKTTKTKKTSKFLPENFQFLVVKFSVSI